MAKTKAGFRRDVSSRVKEEVGSRPPLSLKPRLSILQRVAPPLGLLLLAPWVGEFLLGNKPFTALPELMLLVPMYGGGALFVREAARRTGRGWPTMMLLAAAYALLEEGLITQMLFNPAYLGLSSFSGFAYVPGLETSASIVQAALTMHTVWSICVPIAMIEAFGKNPVQPWLSKTALVINGVVFVVGSVFLAVIQYEQFHFLASPAQLLALLLMIASLVILAFFSGRHQARPLDAAAPKPWLVGLTAFGLSSLYWISDLFLTGGALEWLPVGLWFVLVGASVALLRRYSRRQGWGRTHHLAVAGGVLVTYVWEGFVQAWALGFPRDIAVFGNVMFGVSAVTLLTAAVIVSKMRQKATVGKG